MDIREYIIESMNVDALSVEGKLIALLEDFVEAKAYHIRKSGIGKAFNDWLFGLPTAFNTEIYDNNIMALLGAWGLPKGGDIWMTYSEAILREIRRMLEESGISFDGTVRTILSTL